MEFDLKKRHCYWFNEISKIPHGSRNEKGISDFVVAFAKEHNLVYTQDHVWNVTIDKPASKGYENAQPLILQAHMDMVAEKTSDSNHDFTKDPLDLYVDGDLLKARGTTLGGDDGHGVAYMLAILEDDTLPHPPLECIFTTMEEIGLIGAQQLTKEAVHGHRLICLDGGGEVHTAASSAGGCDVSIDFDLNFEENEDEGYQLVITGLTGGHSGGEIHKEKGNADVIAVRILEEAKQKGIEVNFVSLEGGSKDNAIPREATILFTTKTDFNILQEVCKESYQGIKEELEFSDAKVEMLLSQIEKPEKHADTISTYQLLDMIYLMPNGFQHRSMAIEGLTLTSLNLGIAHTNGNQVHLQTLLRSALEPAVDNLIHLIQTLGKYMNAKISTEARYPGWNYSTNSPLRDKYAQVLKEQGKELEVHAGHGGNECGVFKGLDPQMDIITFGPIGAYIHTPQEQLDLVSFDRSYEILKEIVKRCND